MIQSVSDDDVAIGRHCDAVWEAELASRCAIFAERLQKYSVLRKDLNAVIVGVAHNDVAAVTVHCNPPRELEFSRPIAKLTEGPHEHARLREYLHFVSVKR